MSNLVVIDGGKSQDDREKIVEELEIAIRMTKTLPGRIVGLGIVLISDDDGRHYSYTTHVGRATLALAGGCASLMRSLDSSMDNVDIEPSEDD